VRIVLSISQADRDWADEINRKYLKTTAEIEAVIDREEHTEEDTVALMEEEEEETEEVAVVGIEDEQEDFEVDIEMRTISDTIRMTIEEVVAEEEEAEDHTAVATIMGIRSMAAHSMAVLKVLVTANMTTITTIDCVLAPAVSVRVFVCFSRLI